MYKYEGYALKVFTYKRRKSEVLFEAAVNSLVGEGGIKAPKIYEVIEIEDKDVIKMELVDGKSLFKDLFRSDENIERCLNILVDEQIKIHKVEFNYPITSKMKIEEKILRSKELSHERK